jgi:lysine-N-methylase
MSTIKVLAPDYYNEFHCIGPECPYTCCHNWGEITIDKNTYKKYKDFPSPEFNKKIQWALKPLKKADGSIDTFKAAVIVLDEHGKCPFFSEKGLCEIQQKIGAGYLSLTCRLYPRNVFKDIKPNVETSLTLSCIEVARLAVLRSDKQKFIKIDVDKKQIDSYRSSLSYGGALKDYVASIRQNCIELMQNEEFSILRRISSVSHFLQGMENTINKREDIKTDISINAETVANVLDKKSGAFNDFMRIIAEIIANAFGAEMVNKIGNTDIHRYIVGNSQAEWKDIIETKTLIFENYFVNFIFQKIVPFYLEKLSMSQHAYLLLERYELCRFFIGVYFIKYGKVEDQNIAFIISRIEKHFTHENPKDTVDRILNVYVKGEDL